MYRQGDVLVFSVKNLPNNLEPIERENGHIILAHGEATGHAHAIKSEHATLFRDPKLAAIFMCVADESVTLAHDEHALIAIPPGSYEVRRQREYHPEAIRNVTD
jgi:hypothetical protein